MELNDFEALTWQVFHFQYHNNPVYRKFVDISGRFPEKPSIEHIPFLPVEFFKYHSVLCHPFKPERYFQSSGTSGNVNSRHYIGDVTLYEWAFTKGFQTFYGNPQEWVILGLLPSYLERPDASLVYMVNHLMKQSGNSGMGFFMYNYQELEERVTREMSKGKKVLLFGVTFALLDWAEKFPGRYKGLTIIETGGMKGRRKELIREELHAILNDRLKPDAIHSEYGMTELFSQAYSLSDGIFMCSPSMKILRRDSYDPFRVTREKGRGLANVIDLANLASCSFIATQDVCYLHDNGSFEILGRSDNSDIRGCNLMMEM